VAQSSQSVTASLPSREVMARRRKVRYAKDSATKWMIRAGGGGVVAALALIFVYLFSEVVPMLRGATIEDPVVYEAPGMGGIASEGLMLERYGDLGARFTTTGNVVLWQLGDGEVLTVKALPISEAVSITSFASGEPRTRMHVYGLSDGQVLLLEDRYRLTFPDDQRVLVPEIRYPYGEAPIKVDPEGRPLRMVAVQPGSGGASGAVVAALTDDNRLVVSRITTQTSFMTGEVTASSRAIDLGTPSGDITQILVSTNLRNMIASTADGRLLYYDIVNIDQTRLADAVEIGGGVGITTMAFLNGSISWIVGGSDGSVSQWTLVRDDENQWRIRQMRSFDAHDAPISAIAVEFTRRGFTTGDAAGHIKIHYGTSARTLASRQVSDVEIQSIAMSPVNDKLMVEDVNGQVYLHEIWNEHPDVSFAAFWNKVWYEGRSGPEYVWQASSGADTFEPKLSMVPLTIGTLKAALFAMLFATPIAVAGAIYTAYFMSPKMRQSVKPTIELMEALPTVILGFLAGLWLAPFVESNLPSVFMVLIGLPTGFLLAALLWQRLPRDLRSRIPSGWEALMLVPVVFLTGWVAITLSPYVELWFFDGSMRQWFTDVGITYDQRNALVVGIAMGFAVIPTIFSIAEDAVFTVPKHLTQGSLALGATRWQTVTKVVLLTASPGIFSAVMIGFGRAVGETMIVLMATGNSPVVNFNIFEGMRTLSANIAVELPETAVGSTHFRVMFFAALVLFVLTFIVNTISEIVRQRLRHRYSNL
jgi:phosphate transport system permease protein